MQNKRYRHQLDSLRGETLLIEAIIGARSTRSVDNQFGGFKLRTMCLNEVKCAVKCSDKKKFILKARLDHTWICESLSKIVRDKAIQEGDTVRFFAKVQDYTYSHGAKQLGLVQCNDKQYKVINK